MFSFRNAEAMVLYTIGFKEEHDRCHKFKNPARARGALRWERMIRSMDRKPNRRMYAS
jgi:hypothetical protein